jgi:hypothetical protein
VIDRLEQADTQQMSEPECVEPITFVPFRAGVTRVADYELTGEAPGQVIKLLGVSTFLKCEMNLAAYAAKEIPDGGSVSLDDGLSHKLTLEV